MKMEKVLDKLGIEPVNQGASTGTTYLKTKGKTIKCYSPVDGKLIASVKAVDEQAYDKVVGLTQNAGLEYSDKNIRINCVAPGFINTPLLDTIDKSGKESLVVKHPIGRLGKPNEVAELVIWLSSDKASYATGGYYPIDGGYQCHFPFK